LIRAQQLTRRPARSGASCHGEDLEGIPEVGIGGDRLIDGRGSLASGNLIKTIESYWPYATTVFDHLKRAMLSTRPARSTTTRSMR
jgi:hypothetical protein